MADPEKRIVVLGRIAQAYERDDEAHAFDKALDAAYDAGRQAAIAQQIEKDAGIAETLPGWKQPRDVAALIRAQKP